MIWGTYCCTIDLHCRLKADSAPMALLIVATSMLGPAAAAAAAVQTRFE
jgi:hypothetical protein